MNKRTYKLYCLRRPDKEDPYEPGNWCPFYGGKGKRKRECDHRREAKKLWDNPNAPNINPIRNNIIHKLWEQGLDYIEDIIFVELTNDEACEYEMEFIAAYGRIDLGTGCLANMTNGGDGMEGHVHSEETKRKISISKSGEKHHYFGKNLPEEHCQNISKGKTGVLFSEEAKKNMSESKMGDKNYRFGKPWSEETKKKISESEKGKFVSEETREKLSEAGKKRTHSEETKQKMRGPRGPQKNPRRKKTNVEEK